MPSGGGFDAAASNSSLNALQILAWELLRYKVRFRVFVDTGRELGFNFDVQPSPHRSRFDLNITLTVRYSIIWPTDFAC